MVQTGSRWRHEPSTIKLRSYFCLRTVKSLNFWLVVRNVPVWSLDIVIIEHHALYLETKSRQRVSKHRISRHGLRKCLRNSEHSCGVIPLSLHGSYCWGHSPALTNQNYVFKMTPWQVCQWRLVGSWTPYLVRSLCVPPCRSGPPRRRKEPQSGVSLDPICWVAVTVIRSWISR